MAVGGAGRPHAAGGMGEVVVVEVGDERGGRQSLDEGRVLGLHESSTASRDVKRGSTTHMAEQGRRAAHSVLWNCGVLGTRHTAAVDGCGAAMPYCWVMKATSLSRGSVRSRPGACRAARRLNRGGRSDIRCGSGAHRCCGRGGGRRWSCRPPRKQRTRPGFVAGV